MRFPLTASLLPLFLGSLPAQTQWLVEAGNPAALPDLASAVAVAADGDLIRTRNSAEVVSGLVITKSLRIIGEGSFGFGVPVTVLLAQPNATAPFQVTVAAGKEVILSNFALGWFAASVDLRIDACAGRVILQDVPSGYGRLAIVDSRQVALRNVDFTGSTPIEFTRSTVAIERSVLRGRPANYETSTTSTIGARLTTARVDSVDSTILGGAGTQTLSGSLPGAGAMLLAASTFTAAGMSNVAEGTLTTDPAIDASNSLLILDPAITPTLNLVQSTLQALALPSVAVANFASGQTATLTVRTPVGTLSALLIGPPGDRLTLPGVFGDSWLDPLITHAALIGVQNGALVRTITIPASPALYGTPLAWQAAGVVQGSVWLGAPGGALLR